MPECRYIVQSLDECLVTSGVGKTVFRGGGAFGGGLRKTSCLHNYTNLLLNMHENTNFSINMLYVHIWGWGGGWGLQPLTPSWLHQSWLLWYFLRIS